MIKFLWCLWATPEHLQYGFLWPWPFTSFVSCDTRDTQATKHLPLSLILKALYKGRIFRPAIYSYTMYVLSLTFLHSGLHITDRQVDLVEISGNLLSNVCRWWVFTCAYSILLPSYDTFHVSVLYLSWHWRPALHLLTCTLVCEIHWLAGQPSTQFWAF